MIIKIIIFLLIFLFWIGGVLASTFICLDGIKDLIYAVKIRAYNDLLFEVAYVILLISCWILIVFVFGIFFCSVYLFR